MQKKYIYCWYIFVIEGQVLITGVVLTQPADPSGRKCSLAWRTIDRRCIITSTLSILVHVRFSPPPPIIPVSQFPSFITHSPLVVSTTLSLLLSAITALSYLVWNSWVIALSTASLWSLSFCFLLFRLMVLYFLFGRFWSSYREGQDWNQRYLILSLVCTIVMLSLNFRVVIELNE